MLTRSKRWLATLLAAISTAALAGAEWVTNFDPWLLLAVGMSVAFAIRYVAFEWQPKASMAFSAIATLASFITIYIHLAPHGWFF
jgi:hypothetical protein